MNIVVLSWVRAEKYCDESGDSIYTVTERIQTGLWAAGKHYKRTGPRTLWINRQEVDNWISLQPHVESCFPQASRSGKGKRASASA